MKKRAARVLVSNAGPGPQQGIAPHFSSPIAGRASGIATPFATIRTEELTRGPTTIKHPPEIVNAIEELTRLHSRAPMAIYYACWSTGRDGKAQRVHGQRRWR